jgi:hypothetical protein
MPVQPRTLVPGRHVGQPMRRLELKHFEDMHGGRLRADDEPAAGNTRDTFGGYGWTRTTDPSIMSAVL